MWQAARRAAAALHQAPWSIAEVCRIGSSLAVKAPRRSQTTHFGTEAHSGTTTHALQALTAAEISDKQIADIRQRVFGTHIGNGLPSGRKILRKKLVGEKIAAYYDHGRPIKDPLIVDLAAER